MKQKAELPDSNRLKRLALAVAALAGVLLCGLIAWPFLGAITWALTLAILFSPLHIWIERIVGHPNIAALLSTVIVIVVVVVPAVFVAERLVTEAASGIQSLQARVENGELQAVVDSQPALAPLGNWIVRQFDLPSMMASLATWFSNIGAILLKGSMLQVVEVCITFYLLFYFLRDRLAAWTGGLDAEALQTMVFAVGTEHGFDPLRDWFTALYEVLLGASQGPRFGGFVALYGVAETVVLIDRALAGDLLV
jgi:predicted PurR-regulated permease PerM